MTGRSFAWGILAMPLSLWAGFEVQFTPQGPVTERSSEASLTPVEGLVTVPLANLRRTTEPVSPRAVSQTPYAVDQNQETQLLFGENVLIFEVKGDWARVEAPDQIEFTSHGRWQGYPGWVLKEAILPHPSDFFASATVIARYGRVRQSKKGASAFMELPMGSRVGVIYSDKGWVRVQGPRGEMGWMRGKDVRLDREAPKKGGEVRRAILAAASQFIGEPYYWGGRSGHKKGGEIPSGVDCSGLVNVAYRAAALNAPRDAQEQYLRARPLDKGNHLQPGDLVFLAKKGTPDRVVHVMLYEKGETLIEAVHEANKVRRISFKKKLGRSRKDLSAGNEAGDFIVRFGTFFD